MRTPSRGCVSMNSIKLNSYSTVGEVGGKERKEGTNRREERMALEIENFLIQEEGE